MKDQPAAQGEGAKSPRTARKREKLIRLDDLLAKGDVTGGGKLFGATDIKPNKLNRDQA